MKLFSVLMLVMVAGLQAHAEVKPPGYVYKLYCAPAEEVGPINIGGYSFSEACTAVIDGQEGKYLVMTESAARRGGPITQENVWQVMDEVKTRNGLKQQVQHVGTVVDGIYSESLATVIRTGKVTLKTNGETPSAMSGKLEGRKFRTKQKMQAIFHTESVN